VGLVLPLATESAKRHLPFKKDRSFFLRKIYVSRTVAKQVKGVY